MKQIDQTRARERLDRRRQELEDLRDAFQREAVSPIEGAGGSELSSIDQHPADLATDTFERSKDVSILSTVERSLADVDFALDHLAQGTYGRCQVCGKEIGAARLEARPEARYCIEDQASVERSA